MIEIRVCFFSGGPVRAIVKVNSKDNELQFSDRPKPQIGENELLIQMRAIGVGIHDGYFFST